MILRFCRPTRADAARRGVRAVPGPDRARGASGGAGRSARRGGRGTADRPGHAGRATDERADDRRRAAGMGHRPGRLSLCGPASLRRRLAADPGPGAGALAPGDGVGACAGLLPRELLRRGGAHGSAPGSRRGRLQLSGPVRSRLATRRCSGWAGWSGMRPTTSVWLRSGDVVVMGGAARLAWHGVDRVRHGSSTPVAEGRADQPDAAGGRVISPWPPS